MESSSDVDDDRWTPENSDSPSFIHEKLPKNSDEISTTEEANLTLKTPIKFTGVYRRKGRWRSEISNPFTKRTLYLGSFDTPEEASNARAAKRLEFQNRKETLICNYYRRRLTKSLSNKRPRVDHETIIKDSKISDESSSSKEEDADRSRNIPKKFRGVRRVNSGRWTARIKDRFSKRDIWLGTFDTPEEASIVYEAKRLEFLNRKKWLIDALECSFEEDKEDHQRPENSSSVKQQKVFHKKLVKSDNVEEKSSRKEADLSGTTQTRLIGAYRRLSGRWTSEVKDQFTNQRISLSDDRQRPAMSLSNKPPKVDHETIIKDSNNSDESFSSKEEDAERSRNTPKKFRGVRRVKSGRWTARIKDRFSRRDIWLGTFDTLEEASNNFLAKKLEFQKQKEAGEQIKVDQCNQARICIVRTQTECDSVRSWGQTDQCGESSPYKGDGRKLENSLLNYNGKESCSNKEVDFKFRGVCWEETGRWLSTFDTLEEASNVYAAKRHGFNEQKEAQICMDHSRPKYEPVKCGQQFDVSHFLEQILIDSNGFLLGEFSNLDDELRIL